MKDLGSWRKDENDERRWVLVRCFYVVRVRESGVCWLRTNLGRSVVDGFWWGYVCFVFSLLDASFPMLDLLWLFFLNCVLFPLFSDWIRLFEKKWHHLVNKIPVLLLTVRAKGVEEANLETWFMIVREASICAVSQSKWKTMVVMWSGKQKKSASWSLIRNGILSIQWITFEREGGSLQDCRMGVLLSRLWFFMFPAKEYKIVVVGLDNAGKTTTLYKLHLGEVVVTQPTVGSNVEELVYKNIRFEVWDLGGQERLRPSWATYYRGTHAVVMVVDSTDRDRIAITKDELFKLLQHEELQHAVVLVFANKQDLKDAMTPAEISDALSLHTIKKHDWHIQACCALTGEGLWDGLGWIAQHVTGAQVVS